MASGKSKIGKKLAAKLKMTFIDTDLYIEINQNKSISEIFEQDGESHFRDLERKFIDEIPNRFQNPILFASGGGMACFNGNIEKMKENGIVIYFRHSPKQLLNRLKSSSKNRPLVNDLDDDELISYVETKLIEREKYYLKADIIFNSAKMSLNEMIEEIKNFKKI